MNATRRNALPILRSAVGPINSRLNNVFDPSSNPPSNSDVHRESGGHQDYIFEDNSDIVSSTNTNNNENINQPPNFLNSAPILSRDVATIRTRVDSVLDALQTDQMTPAELSLIQTVRDTASDPSIMTKIVNNSSFQEFMNMYVDQRPQIGESSRRGRSTRLADESDSEGEYEQGMQRRRDSSSSTSSSYRYQYDSGEDINLSHEPLHLRSNESEHQSTRTVQEKALNRLNELCHQISPELGLVSSASGVATGRPRHSSIISDNDDILSSSETEADVEAIKPTMEGAGVPGVPQGPEGPDVPAGLPSPWANPLYFFMVTACIIPLITLAVTAAVHPSPKTWNLLRSGFKVVCARVFA